MALIIISLVVIVVALGTALNVAMNRAAIAEVDLAESVKREAAFKGDIAVFAKALTEMERELVDTRKELSRFQYLYDKLDHQAVKVQRCRDSLCCYCDKGMERTLLAARAKALTDEQTERRR